MKKRIFFLAGISLLFQSCYTYKRMDSSDFEIGKNYKVTLNDKQLKIKLNQINDSTLIVTHKKEEIVISKNKIQELKKRKFSVIKTLSLPVIVILGIVGL